MKLAMFGLLALALLSACTATATRERDIRNLSSVELYERLCASCHGATGRGDGPVSDSMKTRVPDLTRLAIRDGGEFPTEDVRRTIDGRWDRHAHGTRDMPVWGWQLYDSGADDDSTERASVDSLIDRLVAYLRGIQTE